ncbi:MAG TPA: DUF1697 domain-containing protein [Bauldia sp.]|nr:DUF1697 domain-containing protein [Bauldia sp.]
MTAYAALLRAVNVGGTGLIRMADLKALCEGVGFGDVVTLLQSGNVVFTAKGSDRAVAKKLAGAIEESHGFRPMVAVRTADEIEAAMRANPFRAEETSDPSHLLIAFMADDPAEGVAARLAAVKVNRERLHLAGRQLYVHYADGAGTSKVTNVVLERALGVQSTARNWNTVGKLLALTRKIEGG